MKLRSLIFVITSTVAAATATAAPPVELELATERGLQITAPQEWLQLLAGIGIEHVQIRTARSGDQPSVKNVGTNDHPSFQVVGVLTTRKQLRLPGGTFSHSDRAKLKDYFERLAVDGAESLTAPRGRFGLTEKELTAVFADLTPAIDFTTKGQPPKSVLETVQTKLKQKFAIEPATSRVLSEAKPIADEFKGVSIGTAVAIVLRNEGLVFRPEKERGQAVEYHVVVADVDAVRNSTIGKTDGPDPNLKNWPIGWEPDKAPGEAAPSLRESLNAEIDGYSLEEALSAITPRLKLPLYVDQAALAAHNIDPTKVQIRLPKAKYTYKRLIDRVVSQARLGSSLRVDESGLSFLWVTR